MQLGQRLAASGIALAVVTSVVVLPVVTGPQASVHPVVPVVTQIALSGIDRAGLTSSAAPEPPVAARVVTASVPGPTLASAPMAPALVTSATITRPFTLVGVDWSGTTPVGTTVQVRVHENGSWGTWSPLEVGTDHGPDAAEAAAAGVRRGTEPLLTAPGSDGVQVRVDSHGGVAPTDARVTLVDPQSSGADASVVPTPLSTAAAAGDPLRPTIISRSQWGADESLRTRGPVYTGPVQAGFVHHTASTSDYTPAQATAQMRALYAWYTLGLHYSDMAYNFLVDRYGRIYEGRAGGVDRNVLGGHTAGFNQNTFAVSAIGDFDTYKPTSSEADAMVSSIAKLMAWKLALNHRDPRSSAALVSDSSAGTSRFAAGQRTVVPVISGHRDIGSTACPGQYLEALLPRIRTLAQVDMGTQILSPAVTPAVSAYGGTGTVLAARTTTRAAWKLEVFSVCQSSPIRVLAGRQTKSGALSVHWDQKRADGSPALPGTYRLVLSASTGAKVAYPAEVPFVVSSTATSPLGPCAQAARLAQTERYAASVQVARLTVPSSRIVVLAPGDDAGLPEALLAAPLASVKAAPRLLTTAEALPAPVAAEISRRKVTTAYVVGSTAQVSEAVVAQLRRLGVTNVVRLTGVDRATTAAAVARAMGVRGSAVAVSFDAGASLDSATVAAADAAVGRRPLVVVSTTSVPPATVAVLSALGVTSVIVDASATEVPDTTVTAVPGARRVPGASDVERATALAALVAPSASKVSVLTSGRADSRAVAAATGRPLLLAPSPATPVTGWLAAHPRVTHVLAVGGWSDQGVGGLVAAMTGRSAAAAPAPTATPVPAAPAPRTSSTPAPSPTPAMPVAVPASFTFDGSGFGHGVGMSQWGAYGMALAGFTGSAIVQHYYTGTSVSPVADTQDIRVNIGHAKPVVYLRSEPLAAAGGGIEVTVTGAPPVLGTAADVFAVKAGAGSVTVTRTRAGVTTPVGTGPGVTVAWAGTRYPGSAGPVPTVLDVATSVSGLSGTGHRYRYGYVDIAPATAAATTLEVVNSVRIHDEYLLGIGEVSNSWPGAALQAQVLASRTYALARTAVRAACRCQVDNGAGPYHDQTFAGWSKESGPLGANWVAAVVSTFATPTTGFAILSGGRPITAFYFSASGGRTQSSQDVWVTPLPYATSVDDHWSLVAANPYRVWTPRVRTQAQVAAAFGLLDVVRVDLSSRTTGGAVKVAVAYSSTGVATSLSGEALRTKLGLPSTWVSAATPR